MIQQSNRPWRERLHEVIYEADTPAGKAFDVVLIFAIVASVASVALESVKDLRLEYGLTFKIVEWIFTILFTIEYALRIISVEKPFRYIFSFYGMVDLLAIIPTYLSFFFYGTHSLLVIRSFRLLRIFRIFKLGTYVKQAGILKTALVASRQKIIVFIVAVMATVTTAGALMYLIEGEASGYTSIPTSVYWSIVTMTTVGYGDITPQTPWGQLLASVLMILGYAVLAVPTGIVSVEIAKASQAASAQACKACGRQGHDQDAGFCKFCGAEL